MFSKRFKKLDVRNEWLIVVYRKLFWAVYPVLRLFFYMFPVAVIGLLLRKKKKKKVIIFTSQRSGSNLLVSLIASNPDIFVQQKSEVFSKSWHFTFAIFYLNGIASLTRKNVYVAKIFPSHIIGIGLAKFANKAANLGWCIVRLSRESKLDQALSYIKADSSKMWYQDSHEAENLIEDCSARPDVAKIEGSMRRWMAEDRLLALELIDVDYLHLVYEKDLLKPDSRQRTVDIFSKHIGIKSHQSKSNLLRQSKEGQREEFLLKHPEIINHLEKKGLVDFI